VPTPSANSALAAAQRIAARTLRNPLKISGAHAASELHWSIVMARRASSLLRSGLLALSCLFAALGAASCADNQGESAEAGYDLGSAREDLTQKCGADKYNGPQGADVSSWQGSSFNWSGAGVTFGYARISDGTGFVDPDFDINWAAMKAKGILRGAYQYFEPGQNATTQANMMVQKVGKLGDGDMPCMIDVEATGGQSAATIASKVKTWLGIVEAGTGKKPVIYTGAYFWQDNVKDTTFGGYPLWIAAYGPSCPSLPAGWSNWKMWQYCDGQKQYCTNGSGFDRDVFNGTKADLQAFAGGTASPSYGAAYVDQSFPLATTALKMKTGESITASITLKNVGTKAWDSKTRLGTTKPRDRASAFADSSWIGPNRPAGVTGTVAPGGTFKFQFTLHAPDKPGTYYEYFGVVEEGVAWFSDPGQDGPPDDQLEAQIEVVQGDGGSSGTGGSGGTGGGETAGAPSVGGQPGSGGSGGSGASVSSVGGHSGNSATPSGSSEQSKTFADNSGGCSIGARGRSDVAPFALLLVFGLLSRRRRRATAAS
jgi:lysozyme